MPNEEGFSGQTNLLFDPYVLTFAIIPFYLLPGVQRLRAGVHTQNTESVP